MNKFIFKWDELEPRSLLNSLWMILCTNVGSKALKARASFTPTASTTRIRGTTPWRDSTRCDWGCGCFCCKHIGLLLGLDRILLVSYSFVAKPVADLMWLIMGIQFQFVTLEMRWFDIIFNYLSNSALKWSKRLNNSFRFKKHFYLRTGDFNVVG